MPTLLLWITLLLAIINWIVSTKSLKTLDYFTKPAVMISLIAWLWQVSHFQGFLLFFGIALFFSLIGDILLMLPKNLFLPGLVAFLLGHIAYTIGFNATTPPINLASIIILILVFGVSIKIFSKVASSLTENNQQKYKKPVLVYTIVISLMLASAAMTLIRENWSAFPSLLVSLGAALFFISDMLIAWDKFVKPIKWRHLKIRSTYHLGQLGLIIGAVIHYLNH